MDAQQRSPFLKMAKDNRLGSQTEVEKYTSQGIPLSAIEKEDDEKERKKRIMKATILKLVRNSYTNNSMLTYQGMTWSIYLFLISSYGITGILLCFWKLLR